MPKKPKKKKLNKKSQKVIKDAIRTRITNRYSELLAAYDRRRAMGDFDANSADIRIIMLMLLDVVAFMDLFDDRKTNIR